MSLNDRVACYASATKAMGRVRIGRRVRERMVDAAMRVIEEGKTEDDAKSEARRVSKQDTKSAIFAWLAWQAFCAFAWAIIKRWIDNRQS